MDSIDLSTYTDAATTSAQRYLRMSDDVELRVFEFFSSGDAPHKPVVVFVAGWLSAIDGWEGFLQGLIPHYRVVYMETREKGSSRMPLPPRKTDFSTQRLYQDIQEVVAQTVPAGREFVLAGSSLGATTIVEYLLSDCPKPTDSVLIAPNPEFKFPWIAYLFVWLFPPWAYHRIVKPYIKWHLRKFRLDVENEPEQVAKYDGTLDAADPAKLKHNAKALLGYEAWDKLATITTPTLIVGAESDKLHGLENLQRMKQLMPSAELTALASNKATHSGKAGQLVVDYLECQHPAAKLTAVG